MVSDFFVADIENDPTGGVLDIDAAWRDGEKIEHRLFVGWDGFWGWLTKVAVDDSKFRVCFAHNGGGWDWLSLAHYLLHDGKMKRQSMTAICAGSSMVTLTVTVEKRFTVHFCDSLQLLRSSLDKLSIKFLGVGKVNLSGKLPHEIKAENQGLYYDYLRADTENLLLVLEKSLEIIRDRISPINSFGYTIGSTAMKIFRSMREEKITIPWDEELRSFLREGYTGGRVECFQPGKFEGVNVYDINSLYPTVMREVHVPVSSTGFWTTDFYSESTGVYDVSVRQRRNDVPPVLLSGGVGTRDVRGTFFAPELELLMDVDSDCEIKVHRGYVFTETEKVFRDYVDRLYALRLEDRDGPLSLLCKYLLNSLYGKFGQHAEREKIVVVNSWETLYDMVCAESARVRPIDEDSGIYGLTADVRCNFEHVGIAGIITSAARVRLYRGILAAGNDRVVYCDTDSVHIVGGGLPEEMVGENLGQFKLENTGTGVYAGKKLYAFRDQSGEEKVRAKGVSVGGRNGCRLSYSDLERLVDGETSEIECEFMRPATPLQVFGGREPCKFEPKKRTVRMTAYV